MLLVVSRLQFNSHIARILLRKEITLRSLRLMDQEGFSVHVVQKDPRLIFAVYSFYGPLNLIARQLCFRFLRHSFVFQSVHLKFCLGKRRSIVPVYLQ